MSLRSVLAVPAAGVVPLAEDLPEARSQCIVGAHVADLGFIIRERRRVLMA